jgi:hypothetical protein
MPTVNLSPLAGAGWQFFDNNGVILSGGLLYTYVAGTSTPATTYTTSTGNVANSNPIVLNSAGRTPSDVWLNVAVSYKFVLKTAASVTIGTYDNILSSSAAVAADLLAYEAAVAASGGSALVGFINSLSGSTARTVQARLRDFVSVKDFGATGDGTTNDTAAIQAAFNAGGNIYFPPGIYNYTSLTLNVAARVVGANQRGSSTTSATLKCTSSTSATQRILVGDGITELYGVSFEHLLFTAPNAPDGAVIKFNYCAESGVYDCQFFTLNLTARGVSYYQCNTLRFERVRIVEPTGAGIYGEGDNTHRSDVITFINVIVSGNSTSTQTRMPNAIEANGFVNTLTFHSCQFVDCGRGIYRHNTIGATNRAEFIFAHDVEVDFPYYEAVRLAAGSSTYLVNCYLHGSITTYNLYVGYDATTSIDSVSVTGGQITGAYNSGVYQNGNFVKISDVEISGNGLQSTGTKPGVLIGANSISTIITDNHIGARTGYQSSTQNYGVQITAGAAQVVIANNDLKNNSTGPILNGGTSSNSEYILTPNLGMVVPNSWVAYAATAAGSITIGPSGGQYLVDTLCLVPAGTIATFTVVFPAYAYDTQRINIFTSNIITALTLTPGAGQTITGAVTTLAANASVSYAYSASGVTWNRVR